MENIIEYTDKIFKVIGWGMVAIILFKKHKKDEAPSNWILFLLIVFLS